MRLIDADALVRGVVNSEIRMHTRHEVFTSLIYEQPVIEAEPVRHGHWIIKDDWCTCSVCRESMHYSKGLNEKPSIINAMSMRVHYCPSCGAKMDQRKEE